MPKTKNFPFERSFNYWILEFLFWNFTLHIIKIHHNFCGGGMGLASKNQAIGDFFVAQDGVFFISAVPDFTRARQLLQIPPWQE